MRTTPIAAVVAAFGFVTLVAAQRDLGACTPRATIPNGSVCGVRGTLRRQSPFVDEPIVDAIEATANTFELCRDKTLSIDPVALSFVWDSTAKTCKIYNSTITDQNPRRVKGGTKLLYDTSCFECNHCQDGTTTLYNRHFERGTVNPWFQLQAINDTFQVGEGGRFKGSQFFAKFQGQGNGDEDDSPPVVQIFTFCGGATYKLEFNYRFEETRNAQPSFQFAVGSLFSNNEEENSPPISVPNKPRNAGKWVHRSYTWTSSAESLGHGGYILFRGDGTEGEGFFDIDNITLTPLVPT